MKLKDIATKYNVPYKTVCNALIRFGYRQPSKQYLTRRSPVVTYFDTIDSHEKAYLLGFLYTDGYICQTTYGKQWGIGLQSQDKYILEKFKEVTNSTKKIGHYKNSEKFTCNDAHSCEALEKLGIVENKSHKEMHIPDIPKEFLPSFIRGVFDGDGCITLKSSGFSVASIVSNSKTFLEEIAKELNNNGIVTRPIHAELCGRINPIYVMYFSGRENQLKFFDYAYKDASIYLTRKYDKFMKIPRKTKAQ